MRSFELSQISGVIALLCVASSGARAQSTDKTTPAPEPQAQVQQPKQSPQPGKTKQQIAAEQLKQQEHQRVLGVIPSFNVTNIPDAVPLSTKQKFELAFRSATDPVTFVIAGIDAGLSQMQNDYPGYGQGAQGYFKRWGASYADTFDGDMLGNALFPALLHQDPRYFRKGTGSIKSRLWYSILSTVRTKGDNGHWQPNYSNIMGNLAAGGIANLYYPESDRGASLTVKRAFTVTAEGAFGGIFLEFWPDVSHKLFKRNKTDSSSPADSQ